MSTHPLAPRAEPRPGSGVGEPAPLLRRVIGSVLRRVRLRQGRTLRDVAEAAGVSVPYLSEIERGRKEPSSELLAAICRALGLRLADLLDEARDELARPRPRGARARRRWGFRCQRICPQQNRLPGPTVAGHAFLTGAARRYSREREAMRHQVWMQAEAQPTFGDQVFERLLRERIIFLGKEVDDASANVICAQMLLLAADDPDRDIMLYINSPGGSISAGMAVYDTMQFVGNDVVTLAMGLAGSMAQFLLCTGTAGKRYALPHTRVMMHQLSGGIGGSAADIAIQAENMVHVKRTTHELLARHTGHTVEEIARDSDRDRWFTASEAKDYGMIDDVITSAAEISLAGAGS